MILDLLRTKTEQKQQNFSITWMMEPSRVKIVQVLLLLQNYNHIKVVWKLFQKWMVSEKCSEVHRDGRSP